MSVPVMDVRVVRMTMDKFVVPVSMRVWFAGRVIGAVDVLMVFVVGVPVLVFHRLVPVFVTVMLSQVQPDAERHEHGGDDEANRQLIAQEQNRDGCAHKRRD